MKNVLASIGSVCVVFLATLSFAADNVAVVPLMGKVKTTTKTLYYNLPLSSFTPVLFNATGPYVNFISGDWLALFSTDLVVGLAAPLHLDDGAEVTDFTCYVYDNDGTADVSTNSPMYIWRRAVDSPDSEIITTEINMPTTGSSTALQSISAPSIDYPVIDNSQYVYGAYVLYKITEEADSFNQIRFYGCRLTYTLDVVTP